MKQYLQNGVRKKILIKGLQILIVSLLFIDPARAALSTSFVATTATMDPMTSATTLLAAGLDDVASAVTSIGFTFTLNGTAYTQFSVNTNGLMRLGATAVTANAGGTSNANSLATAADSLKICAYWDNLKTTTTTGLVRYKLSGSAPNRVLLVEWQTTIVTANTPANFQVWLYETSNNIRFVYGAIGANSTGYSVGMAASTTNFVSATVASTFASSTVSGASANNTNTLAIASGSSFIFATQPGCAINPSPAANATNISVTPTLAWSAGPGYTGGYDVYFGTSASPLRVSYNQPGNTYLPGTLNPNTVYFWKVVPRNDSVAASGCSTIQFTTAVAPGCANYVAPASNATSVSVNPTLSWTVGSGTTNGYDVFFGTLASPPQVSTNQPGTTYTPSTLLPNTVYFWKVVPKNNGAAATGCTTIQFTTAVAPGCASNFTPVNNTTAISTYVTLNWTAGSGTITGYNVYLGTLPSPPLVATNQAGTSYTSPTPLTPGTLYYWSIVPQNNGALASGCSVQQFTTSLLNYDVTRTTGIAYTSISGTGTSLPGWRNNTSTDDNLSTSAPIGFNFVYSGNSYSTFSVSTNGFLTFNTGTVATGQGVSPYGYSNTSLSDGNAPQSTLVLAPFWDDIYCQGNSGTQTLLDNSIKYLVTGNSPTRILTIEWMNFEAFNSSGTDFNFQVKLYESTNAIDFIYENIVGFDGFTNLNYSYSCGLNASTLSTPPVAGQVFNQLTALTRNFGLTPTSQLNKLPECNSMIHFQPGNYTPYTPPVSLAPSNDNKVNAISLPVYSAPCTDFCGNIYTSSNATASGGAVCSSAGSTLADDDVWFSFLASNTTAQIKVTGSGNYDPTVELSNNSGTVLNCANGFGTAGVETINASGLTVGAQYFIRVYHKGASWGSNCSGDFAICVSAPPVPPVNDECANSILLPVNSTPVFTQGSSTVAASASAGIPVCTVAGTFPDDDVWYKFIAANTTETITVNSNTGFNGVIQLFSGTCGSLTPINCINFWGNGIQETLTANNLTRNATYYFRVYHAFSGPGTGSFSVAVSSPSPPCSGLLLPPSGDTGVSNDGIDLLWEPVPGVDNYKILFDVVNPPVQVLTITTDTFVNTGQLGSLVDYYWAVLPGNGTGYTTCAGNHFQTELRDNGLITRFFIEGMYNSATQTMIPYVNPADTIADTVTVNLVDIDTVTEFSIKTVVSVNGYATVWLPGSVIDSDYYIVIEHRNTMQTWSRLFSYTETDTTFDFTDSIGKAYGGNMKLIGSQYVFYTGDINQDHKVDKFDIPMMGNLCGQFESPYGAGDINFDKITESLDMSLLENKFPLNLHRITPFGP